VDKFGNIIDFYLSATRNTKAAKRFLGKALRGLKDWEKPHTINTDKAPTYSAAISELKTEGKCPEETEHRQVKYLNNIVEADHGKLKQLIRPVRGFKTMKSAYATIKGFEVMRALRKGQAGIFNFSNDVLGEARIVERAFDLEPCALAEAMTMLENHLQDVEALTGALVKAEICQDAKFATEPFRKHIHPRGPCRRVRNAVLECARSQGVWMGLMRWTASCPAREVP